MHLNLSITVCAVPDCKLDTLQILKNYSLHGVNIRSTAAFEFLPEKYEFSNNILSCKYITLMELTRYSGLIKTYQQAFSNSGEFIESHEDPSKTLGNQGFSA